MKRKQAKRCERCAFWAEKKHSPGWGDCALTRTESAKGEYSDSLALAQDYESYSAVLETDAAFGCVQFKPKG